jgi:hypothetical protein
MDNDTIEKLIEDARVLRNTNPNLREGQSLMLALLDMDRDLYYVITESNGIDCFYRDDLIPAFWNYVMRY